MAESQAIQLVDCDVHPHFRNGLADLDRYLPQPWARRLKLGRDQGWSGEVYSSQYVLPKNDLYIPTPGPIRRDAVPPDGSTPASDPGYVAREHLDRYQVDRALLIGGNTFGIGVLPNPTFAEVICSAYNDWLLDTWAATDPRYKLAIVVPPRSPAAAVREIDRLASNRSVAAVTFPLIDLLLGNPHFLPLFEAAEHHRLPVVIHLSGTEGVFTNGPRLPGGGAPQYFLEWRGAVTQVFQANLVSAICAGVFERFPALKLVLAEGGIAWILEVMWRLDQVWKSVRDETPWLRRPPSDYVRSNVRFTSQPFLEPDKREHLLSFLELIEGDRLLLFSSDYPHWDFDNPMTSLSQLPPQWQRRIKAENAVQVFGERLETSAGAAA